MPSPEEIDVGGDGCQNNGAKRAKGARCAKGNTNDEAPESMSDRARHPSPYEVFAMPVKPKAGKTCDQA